MGRMNPLLALANVRGHGSEYLTWLLGGRGGGGDEDSEPGENQAKWVKI